MSEAQELQFRKKPVVIEAFRLGEAWPDWWAEKHGRNEVTTHNEDGRWRGGPDYALIHTLEGVMRAERGDWIIRGVQGELYPCKPDIFAATYEPASERNTRPTEGRLVGALEEAERALEEIADGTVGLDKAGHYLAHRKAVNAARAALTRIRAAKGGE